MSNANPNCISNEWMNGTLLWITRQQQDKNPLVHSSRSSSKSLKMFKALITLGLFFPSSFLFFSCLYVVLNFLIWIFCVCVCVCVVYELCAAHFVCSFCRMPWNMCANPNSLFSLFCLYDYFCVLTLCLSLECKFYLIDCSCNSFLYIYSRSSWLFSFLSSW